VKSGWGNETEAEKAAVLRAAALEAMSSYYSTVENEFGKAQGLVGPKFIQIVEEPHETKEWMGKEIEDLKRGGKLNLPAFASYAAVFGEKSAMLDEILGRSQPGAGTREGFRTAESGKNWEYLKTLQMMDMSAGGRSKASRLQSPLETVPLSELEMFEKHSGRFGEPGEKGERIMSGTVLDVEKYPYPFMTQIPKGKGPEGEVEYDPFYVPGPLARQVYPEPSVAGEYGMETPVRRLQHVINMAKKAEMAITGKGLEKKHIEKYLPGKAVAFATSAQGKPLKEKEMVFEQLRQGLRDLPVEEAYQTETEKQFAGAAYAPGISELEYIDEFLRRKIGAVGTGKIGTKEEAYDQAIHRIIDILFGSSPETVQGGGARSELADAPSRFAKLLEEEGTSGLENLMEDIDVRITDEDVITKALKNLEKAKVDYMKELTKTALGKTGAIASTMFLRKTPAYMTKATAAIVDKTEDLKMFSEQLKKLAGEADLSEFSGTFTEVAGIMTEIRQDHKEIIDKYIDMGLPVLKQTELGVPERIAKKIPVSFEKKFGFSKERGVYKRKTPLSMEKSNLADMMSYREELEEGMENIPMEARYNKKGERYSSISKEDVEIMKEEIRKHIKEELQPYIESTRYPFTGTSSIQPYEAKILKPRAGERDVQKYALQVPGTPEMRLGGKEGFQEQMKRIFGVREDLIGKRETLQMESDKGVFIPPDRIKRLTSLIDELNKAISDVLPKYTAVQQKLDFDGDQIQIHSGILKAARADIEKHFKAVTEYKPGTGQAWREKWTYEETLPSTSQKFPLADTLKGWEKKWAPEKGFKFMESPEVTETMSFLNAAQALDILGETVGEYKGKRFGEGHAREDKVKPEALGRVVKEISKDFIREPKYLRAIEVAVDNSAKGDMANAESIIAAIGGLEKPISALVENALKQRVYEKKSDDAIIAQLFKIHTGRETESIYRLHRVAERRIGFGGGMIDPTQK